MAVGCDKMICAVQLDVYQQDRHEIVIVESQPYLADSLLTAWWPVHGFVNREGRVKRHFAHSKSRTACELEKTSASVENRSSAEAK